MRHYLIIDGNVLEVYSLKRDELGGIQAAYVINGDWHFKRNVDGRCFALHSNGYSMLTCSQA